ncbi:MAG: ATP-dependent DNA helicase [Clostridia bacterium]|nr:ATP-dependent DNA helicase [Clostridia bacterium]
MKYNKDTCAIEMTVRSLCEKACRCGNIDNRRSASVKTFPSRKDVFSKISAETEGYLAFEQELTHTVRYKDVFFTVSGRADSIVKNKGTLSVDEICVTRGYGFFAPPSATSLAILKCHAYFCAVKEKVDSVGGRIAYYNIDSGKTKYFYYSFTCDELRLFYESLLERVRARAELEIERLEERLPTIASAPFPYSELREGQEIMIKESYSAIKRGKRLFVSAPTGIGKTVSALYPALKALGEGRCGCEKIFYLTAKSSTGREAFRAASKMHSAGAKLRVINIAAKEHICMRGGSEGCDHAVCPYATTYHDRADTAIFELLSEHSGFTPTLIREKAKKYCLCAYELSLELSEYCDVIICDYNYAFDPSVYMRRYFGSDKEIGKYVFLIDEAHNLPDRAREMYSAVLKLSDFTELFIKASESAPDLAKIIGNAAAEITKLKRLCRDNLISTPDGDRGFYMSGKPLERFNVVIDIFRKKSEGWMKKNREHPLYRSLEILLGHTKKYLCINEIFDNGFLCCVEVSGGDISAKIFCLDPSHILDGLLCRASSAVLFSATLAPMDYFISVLGGSKKAERLILDSPFSPEHLGVAVVDKLSVRYEDRAKNASAYASVIAATVSKKHGNYIAYFPSYECLSEVLEVFVRKYPKVDVVVQKPTMGYREREEFLSAFKDKEGRLTIGFCVLGGAFSEGVDLPGSRLIGAIIFGVGLPSLSNERNIMRDYFDARDGEGYDYAYTYPGMNNVLQAAGRVIRRESDKGVIVLVDDRYAEPKYRVLFPKLWQNIKYAGNITSLAEIMRCFWENADNK